ncbi:pyrroline-5-carboxylate reductase [Basilea psittacipulmonis]|uniref:Pyrroline-5-carboxylate reductase n=1 Tax=Basilea psittacipulmonis DSM 24701 TaxID=1072685 RepID=A0A077DEE6_9BURK|nr:pyrroline-5-carboxylate reductase [Basilea psittacipulmonis]AIL32541.1 hypothetical protein IX83_03770 [Basilea psittacipulmonis DSM 24701]
MSFKIAFIGAGNMATAIVKGLLKENLYQKEDILLFDQQEETCQKWIKEEGIQAYTQANEALRNCDLVVLAVKPQVMQEVVMSYLPYLKDDSLILSIAAGISLDKLNTWLSNDKNVSRKIVRVMPNTPCLVGQGASAYFAMNLSEADNVWVQRILGSLGVVVACQKESELDAVTALSGSGPAYVFLFIESLIKGAVSLGLTEQDSRTLALQTLKGAVALMSESGESAEVLRQKVTSKGGTTAAALGVFEQSGFKQIVSEAMSAADKRSKELSQM